MRRDLQDISLADLLVELLLDGRAGYIAHLAPLEPMAVTAILAELQNRTGQDRGNDYDSWCAWFLSDLPDVTESDRGSVELARTKRRLKEFERRAERKRRL